MQRLIDRTAVSDAVNAYATAVDTRDWELFGSLFADKLFLDFRSFHPSLYREVTREELVGITRSIEAFDATQHLSCNHRHSFSGDRATCVSYMHAGHFLKRDGEEHACFLYGHYTYELFRSGDGWLIDKYGMQITAQFGEPKVFEWVGMR
ncbi:MAG: nuclear transport factor 2 family protein [Novosphingobium sp.]